MVRRWGTVRGYGGPTVVMLSAVDSPPWTKRQWQPCMVRGDHASMAAPFGPGGPIMGGPLVV